MSGVFSLSKTRVWQPYLRLRRAAAPRPGSQRRNVWVQERPPKCRLCQSGFCHRLPEEAKSPQERLVLVMAAVHVGWFPFLSQVRQGIRAEGHSGGSC